MSAPTAEHGAFHAGQSHTGTPAKMAPPGRCHREQSNRHSDESTR